MIKKLIRAFLVNVFALWLTAQVVSGLSYHQQIKILAMAAGVLTLANYLIKPLIKILLLPLNVITLGTFRWVVHVIILFLVTYAVPGFTITSFYFTGFSYSGVSVAGAQISLVGSYVVCSLIIGFITACLFWLID